VTRVRRAARSGGAGESGLSELIELHGVQAAADTLIGLALAGSLFFSVPVGEARGKVALYLLTTMAPFALLAPVIGPALDHFRHGRRYAMAAALSARGVLAWVLAGALAHGDALRLYPAAFGILVLSRAYGITRSAAVPRLLPKGTGLVKANARVNLAALLAALLAAPVGGALVVLAGPEWSLRLATLVCGAAAVLALRLPAVVDSASGERPVPILHRMTAEGAWWTEEPAAETPERPPSRRIGPMVARALRHVAVLRMWTGFLTLFLAFLLRSHPFHGWPATVEVGLVAGSAALGNATGTTLGARLRSQPADRILGVALVAVTGTAALGAIAPALLTLMVVALTAATAASMGKLALDATIQDTVPDRIRTSVFGRSETLLQLAWVLGGGIGTALPLRAGAGLGLAAAGLATALVLTRVRRK
jgi:MFS family permease